MARLGRAYPVKRQFDNTFIPVQFDATGGGSAGNFSSTSWSHTVNAGAYVIVDLVFQSPSATITALTVGGVAGTLLGKVFANNNSVTGGFCTRYIVPRSAGGALTVSVTLSGSFVMAANSVSYNYVGSYGSTATTFGSSATVSQTATVTRPGMVSQLMMQSQNGTFTTVTGGTSRYTASTGSSACILIMDTSTSGTLTGSTGLGSADWSALNTPLLPIIYGQR